MRHLVLVTALAALAACGGHHAAEPHTGKPKVVILGFDGMDPDLVRRFMAKGEMPNMQKLSAQGGLFDLTPTDEQKMIVEATAEFAAEQLRPAAASADSECAAPAEILKRAVTELGMTQLAVPEALGGMGGERSATTGVLVNEALAHGDIGLARFMAGRLVNGALRNRLLARIAKRQAG